MKIWKMKKDNRGLSLVELICAVAIFAVIGTAVGGIMVVTANSYTNGTNEVSLQQEAQLTANQIADLLIDTTAEVQYDGTSLTVQRVDKTYTITYAASESKLYYVESDAAGHTSGVQLLAENVTEFSVDTTDFATRGNARVRLKFEKDDRAFESWYTVAARNGMGEAEALEETAALVTMSEITLEPNEQFELKATVVGSVGNKGVVWGTLQGASCVGTQINTSGGKTIIKIDKDEVAPSGSPITIPVSTAATKNGSPMATALVKVYVRRVNAVDANGWRASGVDCKDGAVYKVSAPCVGDNLSRVLGVEYDSTANYKNPYYCEFDCEFTVDGSPAPYGPYFDVDSSEDVNAPSLKITLKQDMPSNSKFTVRTNAKHPKGNIGGTDYNKSGSPYADVTDTFEIVQAELPEGPHEIPSGESLRRGGTTQVGFPQSIYDANKKDGEYSQSVNQIRYKISGTTDNWCEWKKMREGSGTSFHFQAGDFNMLDPDKDYDIQVRTVIVKNGVDWNNRPITDADIGWPTSTTPESEYLTNFHISKVRLYFRAMDSIGFPDACLSAGTPESPIVVKKQGGYEFKTSEVIGAVGNEVNGKMKVKYTNLSTNETKTSDIGTYDEYIGNGVNVNGSVIRPDFGNFSTGVWKMEIIYKDSAFIYNDSGSSDSGPGVFYFKVTN